MLSHTWETKLKESNSFKFYKQKGKFCTSINSQWVNWRFPTIQKTVGDQNDPLREFGRAGPKFGGRVSLKVDHSWSISVSRWWLSLPLWKILVSWDDYPIPYIMENKKCVKPPTRYCPVRATCVQLSECRLLCDQRSLYGEGPPSSVCWFMLTHQQ